MVASVLTDLPYLEELVLFLKKSECIKENFQSIGSVKVFVDPGELKSVLEKGKECPFNEALWIFSGGSTNSDSSSFKCPLVKHEFAIVVIKKCTDKHFQWERSGGELNLEGDYMDLSHLRKILLNEMKKFDSEKGINLRWVETDSTNVEGCFLFTSIKFEISFSF